MYTLILVLLFAAHSPAELAKKTTQDKVTLTTDEQILYDMIMEYRKKKNLPAIPLNKDLTYVAQEHARDLMENQPDQGNCNLHSWSDQGDWTACCYTDDHAEAECLWNKPREMTEYEGNGYEIAAWNSAGATPARALRGWIRSSGHHELIINKGIWKSEWKSIGVGMNGQYTTVWFGRD